MMTRELENIDQRLRYGETAVITRDELAAIEADLSAAQATEDECMKALDEASACKKQRNLCREVIEGLVECIDDEGVVTPGDKSLLAQRIKSAVKFINNLED